jgi:phosphoglycolate phosphatase-like HAD superfamily hydrolase
VKAADRIAVFDNDGTLWAEQPLYVYVLFAAAEMKALASKHPEWAGTPGFQPVITGDGNAIFGIAPADQFAVAFAVHSARTIDDYSASARQWLATQKHPRFQRLYTELAYQPMLELIGYLRANEFQVYSVTGSEIDFVRVVNEQAFTIPRDHVIATVLKTKFDAAAQPAAIVALPEPLLVDDGDGKPISIHNVIGQRPIAAFGNSDGDLSMLEWTAGGSGARLAALVHHDDAVREFAYDRASAVGKLDKALDAAQARKWSVISMKSDWKTIFR